MGRGDRMTGRVSWRWAEVLLPRFPLFSLGSPPAIQFGDAMQTKT